MRMPSNTSIARVPPHISIFEAVPLENPRALPQQSVHMLSNLKDIESYNHFAESRGEKYLETFDIPLSEKAAALSTLAKMGISDATMFPGVEGTCAALRYSKFER